MNIAPPQGLQGFFIFFPHGLQTFSIPFPQGLQAFFMSLPQGLHTFFAQGLHAFLAQGLQTFFIFCSQGLAGLSALLKGDHLGPAQEKPGKNMNKERTNIKEKNRLRSFMNLLL
jgi:hypothetical protein